MASCSACSAGKMFGGGNVEFFTEENKSIVTDNAKGNCLFTAQGELVCNVNTEYQKWLINDKNEYSAPFGYQRTNTFTGFNLNSAF